MEEGWRGGRNGRENEAVGDTRMAVWQFSRLGDRVEVEFEFFEFLAGFSELINAGRSVTTGSNFSLMNHGAPSTNFRDQLSSQFSSSSSLDICYNICIADDKSLICCASSSRERESPPSLFSLSLSIFIPYIFCNFP